MQCYARLAYFVTFVAYLILPFLYLQVFDPASNAAYKSEDEPNNVRCEKRPGKVQSSFLQQIADPAKQIGDPAEFGDTYSSHGGRIGGPCAVSIKETLMLIIAYLTHPLFHTKSDILCNFTDALPQLYMNSTKVQNPWHINEPVIH